MKRVQLKATNTTLTAAITDYVNAKLSEEALSKFTGFKNILDVNVDIGKTTEHHTNGDIYRAEINVRIKGNVLRAVSEKEDLYSAIDDVRDEIVEVLKGVKSKKETLWKRGSRKIKDMLRWGRAIDNA